MLRNALCETCNRQMNRLSDWLDTQVFECCNKRLCEGFQSIAVDFYVLAFDIINDVAHLSRRQLFVFEEADELSESPLEVDVVFPEGVIGIDEEGSHPITPPSP